MERTGSTSNSAARMPAP